MISSILSVLSIVNAGNIDRDFAIPVAANTVKLLENLNVSDCTAIEQSRKCIDNDFKGKLIGELQEMMPSQALGTIINLVEKNQLLIKIVVPDAINGSGIMCANGSATTCMNERHTVLKEKVQDDLLAGKFVVLVSSQDEQDELFFMMNTALHELYHVLQAYGTNEKELSEKIIRPVNDVIEAFRTRIEICKKYNFPDASYLSIQNMMDPRTSIEDQPLKELKEVGAFAFPLITRLGHMVLRRIDPTYNNLPPDKLRQAISDLDPTALKKNLNKLEGMKVLHENTQFEKYLLTEISQYELLLADIELVKKVIVLETIELGFKALEKIEL